MQQAVTMLKMASCCFNAHITATRVANQQVCSGHVDAACGLCVRLVKRLFNRHTVHMQSAERETHKVLRCTGR